ncbi:unnamed protein product [Cylindrotheca closterium]|uniref:Uncharacterized protein n=1 Tax=Cylindrotheca closterium TaxID=2856 RepID=A0AAD2FND2_9STRA|nr:unnamed protein product [Cylindrotheca closterium]
MLASKKVASKRISSTPWIGSVGGEFDDLKVDVDSGSRVGTSSELKAHCIAEDDDYDVKVTAVGLAGINLTRDKDGPIAPLQASQLTPAFSTEPSVSIRSGTRRSTSSRRGASNRGGLSMFTNHTTTTMVSSTYHSSDLDSFSEGVPDSEMDSEDESLQPSTDSGDSRDGDDEIKSILSSDFDSLDLEFDEARHGSESLDDEPSSSDDSSSSDSSVSERDEPTSPQHEKQNKAELRPDMRWNALESSPSLKSNPFAPHSEMISNSSLFVQVAEDEENDHRKSGVGGGGFVYIRGNGDDYVDEENDYVAEENEHAVPCNDAKEIRKSNVADVLEYRSGSEHTSFLLELDHNMQRNVSGLTLHSGLGRQTSHRATRRGGKRNRAADAWQNEVWNHEPDVQREIDGIPNQPLPPPPPPSSTPPHPSQNKKNSILRSQSYSSKVSKVSALSTPTMEGRKSVTPRHLRKHSSTGSFESSWDSTIMSSPRTAKGTKKLRVDGAEGSGRDALSSPENPTFHPGNRASGVSLDIPPPPPARHGTPRSQPPPPPPLPPGTPDTPDNRSSNNGRPSMVNMRELSKLSTITSDSALTTPTVKERHRKNLERLNDQMNAAIGVSPRLRATKSSGSNLSIVERRESVRLLREKLQHSFRHVVFPGSPKDRKTKGNASSIPSVPDTRLRESSFSPTSQYRRTARK